MKTLVTICALVCASSATVAAAPSAPTPPSAPSASSAARSATKAATKPAAVKPLKLGDALPDVTAPDQDGKPVVLREFGGKGFLLVYFYPKADTPGCTKQACSLRDSYAELQTRGVKVLGVSLDTPEAQKKFQEKNKLPFSLLADKEKKAVVTAFGVPVSRDAAGRQAFLFEDGKCVWLDYKAATSKQAADVLKFLNKKK
ncbi:MAG: peroxiredoxin [Puniceicoccales bacterium]|jgi:peroxiredoxin Q/BCP|nr:peroxiredoxin [Puniceicoccales bacterium]